MAANAVAVSHLVGAVQSPLMIRNHRRTRRQASAGHHTSIQLSSSSVLNLAVPLQPRSLTPHRLSPRSCLSPLPSSSSSPSPAANGDARSTASTRLYVSGLSFRTTKESLRNAFQNFGQLLEVNLVMDKIANRPRGFAFIRYATEEESKNAIVGMHGKFLDGRVIFVEVAKRRSELRRGPKQ